MTDLPEPLLAYFAQRETDRANDVASVWNNLTPREQGLVHDAAVMGYVQGMRHPEGERIGKDRDTIALVLDACLAFDDLYPTVATVRDAARQVTGQPAVERPDPTTADDPTPLRWGLNDVLYSDDDTIIVCLSGPDGKPYWLELTPDQAAVLRDDLAGPEPAVEQPAEAQPAEAHPPREQWTVELLDVDGWMPTGLARRDRDVGNAYLAARRERHPDLKFRLVRETTTWTIEETP